MKNKAVYIIAGPNGSGKTTFAKRKNSHREIVDKELFEKVQKSAR